MWGIRVFVLFCFVFFFRDQNTAIVRCVCHHDLLWSEKEGKRACEVARRVGLAHTVREDHGRISFASFRHIWSTNTSYNSSEADDTITWDASVWEVLDSPYISVIPLFAPRCRLVSKCHQQDYHRVMYV